MIHPGESFGETRRAHNDRTEERCNAVSMAQPRKGHRVSIASDRSP
jgi:hypothetical protein